MNDKKQMLLNSLHLGHRRPICLSVVRATEELKNNLPSLGMVGPALGHLLCVFGIWGIWERIRDCCNVRGSFFACGTQWGQLPLMTLISHCIRHSASLCTALARRQSLGWRVGTPHLLKPDTFLIAFPKQPLKQVYCKSSKRLRLENGHRRESGYHTGSLASLKNPLRTEALCEPLRGLLLCRENGDFCEAKATLGS